MRLEDLAPNVAVRGLLPDEALATVVDVRWFGSEAVELTYKTSGGRVANELLYRNDEARLEIAERGRPWRFDGDGAHFRLVSEALRIRLAHLFDPMLAVHTSVVEPLPHQITAVYDAMLPRQPLRFLLADDPGAGKTIMAGLLVKELMARGDVERCLVVCPGSLAEQWQDELRRRFHLPFEILTNDKLEAAGTGNWFLEADLAIARLDKLARDEDVQEKLKAPDCRWDLVVCDEAHKMSATYFGGEVKYTKRHRLGRLLSGLARHFLLMTATPHNGKEQDFQLFMSLLDEDRFEGRFRDGVHESDASDLMRRVVKESLVRFDGTPVFPRRRAHTVPYRLSEGEVRLYDAVTDYVREEFDRAAALEKDRRGTVGFALTVLQRRVASSPRAIHRSLVRRRERLEERLREMESARAETGGGRASRAGPAPLDEALPMSPQVHGSTFDFENAEAWDDLDEATEAELHDIEADLLGQATAARSMAELRAEIATLGRLERLADGVLRGGEDAKWQELAGLLDEIFTPAGLAAGVAEGSEHVYGAGAIPAHTPSPSQKLVVFTEHRDTLEYLRDRIGTRLGRPDALVVVHGSLRREERLRAQEAFRHDPETRILLATDAAGEGINLQRAHLMVNYDLPWNPNRLEQRFGRIHRIGQREVCHLWNLVADGTREGDVYQRLLDKLETARQSLGGQVFDVLGRLHFEGKPLRDLLLQAVRYGARPDVRAHLTTVLDETLDQDRLRDLIEERALAHDAMDSRRLRRVRESMERAEARRLQPHYVESFFKEAFGRLGGAAKQREPRRYEIARVPSTVRAATQRRRGREPALSRYERIVFEKEAVPPPGKPVAAFVCPGHPLLDAVLDLTLERHGELLKRGATLVDNRDSGREPRVLFYLEHAVQDGGLDRSGARRVISKRMLHVELRRDGAVSHVGHAPYLDYRPLADDEPSPDELLERPECAWITAELEQSALGHAVAKIAPEHVAEVRAARVDLVDRTEAAVKDRLTKEINYWDRRAQELKAKDEAGAAHTRLAAGEAAKRADVLQTRMKARLGALKRERLVSSLPPVVLGGVLVAPIGLLARMSDQAEPTTAVRTADTQAAAARARAAVMDVERTLGFEPVDREFDRVGYDIESRDPETGGLRFIEVKGRVAGAVAVTVTRNEILTSLNKPDGYVLALVEFRDDGTHEVRYLRRPFKREPDFGVTSVNYDFAELLARAGPPS